MPLIYPAINGTFPDFSSIEVVGNTKRFTGFTAVNYNDSLDAGEVRGVGSQKIGETRGQYKAEAGLELYLADFDDFITSLVGTTGKGYMEARFSVNINYSEPDLGFIQTVNLVGCRIKKVDNSHQMGTDPLKAKLDLSLFYIVRNGKFPIGISQALGTRF